ncbi:hypothetical protein Tco_0417317 [Tanacetum coccineum]
MEESAKQYTIMFSNTSSSPCKRSMKKRRKKESRIRRIQHSIQFVRPEDYRSNCGGVLDESLAQSGLWALGPVGNFRIHEGLTF